MTLRKCFDPKPLSYTSDRYKSSKNIRVPFKLYIHKVKTHFKGFTIKAKGGHQLNTEIALWPWPWLSGHSAWSEDERPLQMDNYQNIRKPFWVFRSLHKIFWQMKYLSCHNRQTPTVIRYSAHNGENKIFTSANKQIKYVKMLANVQKSWSLKTDFCHF